MQSSLSPASDFYAAEWFVHDATPARKMLARIRRGITGNDGLASNGPRKANRNSNAKAAGRGL